MIEKLPRGVQAVINRASPEWSWTATRGCSDLFLFLRLRHADGTRRAVAVWQSSGGTSWRYVDGFSWPACEHGLPAKFPRKITNTELKEIIGHEPT